MKTIHKHAFVLTAALALLWGAAGCMDLYDDEEVQTVFTLTLNGNGGTYTADGTEYETYAQTFVYGSSITLKDDFSRSGYDFDGWAHTQDADSATYGKSADVTLYADTTLYAVWKERTGNSVEYIDNVDDAVITVPNGSSYEPGEQVTVSFDVGERPGYTFAGWSVSGLTGISEYLKEQAPVTFAMPSNTVVLSAKWIANAIKGSNIEMTVTTDSDAALSLTPTATKNTAGAVTGVTFTVASGYNYSWLIDNATTKAITQSSSNDSTTTFSWDLTNITAGEHCVMFIATASGKTYSATVYVTITK